MEHNCYLSEIQLTLSSGITFKECWPVSKLLNSIHNSKGVKILTRLGLGFSHLNKHSFNKDLESCISPLCYIIVWKLSQNLISFYPAIIIMN